MDNINSNSNNDCLFSNQQEYLNQIFSTPQYLEEYFLIIGIDPKICFNQEIFSSCLSLNELNDFFIKNDVKPTIISKFPPVKKSYINIDCSLINICFPNFQIEEYNSEPDPVTQYLILDNSFYSIDYPHSYITCFKFYEKFSDYYKLNSYKTKNNCKEKINEKFNNYYIPKIICLISTQKHFNQQGKIIKQIYQYYKENIKKTIPMEKIILNILFNIPIPSKDVLEILYNIMPNYEIIKIKPQQMNKFPYIPNELKYIFTTFKINYFLEIFKYTLYETKTVIFSTNINNITFFISGLINLLYPLKYSFQICSSITSNVYNVLESISPYILGINKKYKKTFFKENKIDISDQNILIIDLDDQFFKYKGLETLPNIPTKFYNDLHSHLEAILKKINYENIYLNIQDIFFKFFVNIFHDYNKYLNNDFSKTQVKYTSLKNIFHIKEYLDSREAAENLFYKKITETQMFNSFIYKKIILKDNNDEMNIIFFDENIAKEKNKNRKKIFHKKSKSEFYNDFDYLKIFQTPLTQNLNNEEKKIFEVINFNQIFNEFLSYGQMISINKNEINFEYLIFPKLNEIFYYNACLKEFFQKQENINTPHVNGVNTVILSKHNKKKNSCTECDKVLMKNYIYLTYVELWSYTYGYHDSCEKEYRFNELLQILDLISNHEIENFNLCFETLYKFKEKDKILKLYDKILKHNITINSNISAIINDIQSKCIQSSTNELNNKGINFENFQKRTFKPYFYKNIINGKIKLHTKQICPNCSKIINLRKILLNEKNITKNESWVKCPSCKQFILPELGVSIGDDIIFKKSKNTNDREYLTFKLYSPYELKMKIKQIKKNELPNFDAEKFKEKYHDIFWSYIWFFEVYKINYDFILPYERNINKEIELNSETLTNNINSEINDKIFKEIKYHKIKKPKNKKIKMSYKNNKSIIRNSIVSFSISYNNNNKLYSKKTIDEYVIMNSFSSFESNNFKRVHSGSIKLQGSFSKNCKKFMEKSNDNNKNNKISIFKWKSKNSINFDNNNNKNHVIRTTNSFSNFNKNRIIQKQCTFSIKSNNSLNLKDDEISPKNKNEVEYLNNDYSRKFSLSSLIESEECKNESFNNSPSKSSNIKINRNVKAKSIYFKKRSIEIEFSNSLNEQRANSEVIEKKEILQK